MEASGPSHDAAALQLIIASEIRFVRESLAALLGDSRQIAVVALCGDVAAAESLSRELCPHVVLLDAAMQDGAATARALREIAAGPQVIVFGVHESVDAVLGWAEAGVAGYIPSSAPAGDLARLVGEISEGRQACCSKVVAGMLRRIGARSRGAARMPDAPPLTPRELEIASLISKGLSNKDIARRLNIGVATTKSHVHHLLAKLQLRDRGQAASWMRVRTSLYPVPFETSGSERRGPWAVAAGRTAD